MDTGFPVSRFPLVADCGGLTQMPPIVRPERIDFQLLILPFCEPETGNWKLETPKILLAIWGTPSLIIAALIFSIRSAGNQQIQRRFGELIVSPLTLPFMHPVDNKSNIVFFVFLIFLTFLGTNIALCLLRVLQ
jgi:hypothetical protein